MPTVAPARLGEALRSAGVGRGDLVALAASSDVGLGVACSGASWSVRATDPASVVAAVEEALRPRWTVWDVGTPLLLARAGVRVATAWDLAAVHRVLFGGWRAEPGAVWAALHDLPVAGLPTDAPPDLFSDTGSDGDDVESPVRPDGYLRADWAAGAWSQSPERCARWAELALDAVAHQRSRLRRLAARPRAEATARAESAAELLCAEMTVDGLPLDRTLAEATIGALVGPRPADEADAAAGRARRDAGVLTHVPGMAIDLRSPGQVKALLARVGIEVPDTRAGRLRALSGVHPVVDALLAWRKAERVATTYGYGWLDDHVGADGRLRGTWSGADGAAGRMTASAGLHNLPADLRGAVVAEPGSVFVRADLGQIEPRVLAAVSGDGVLAAATTEPDLYAPVATALGVDRATAKVAVLGAMYGQTTGHGATALRRLNAAYPVAMAYLDAADRAARAGRDIRTYGGRLVRMGPPVGTDRDDESPAATAARGRFGRNAVVQGAAAELFKMWAVTVRARVSSEGGCIVLCLHDELLVQAPEERGEVVARLVDACLQEAAHRWAPDDRVRFVADIGVIRRWSDAKS